MAQFPNRPVRLRGWLAELPEPPRALRVISTHWEQPLPTLQTGAQSPLLFGYDGFPPHTDALRWPAPGAPKLAARAPRSHCDQAGSGPALGCMVVAKKPC